MSGGGVSSSGPILKELVEGRAWFEFVENSDFDFSQGLFAAISSSFGDRQQKGRRASPCFANRRDFEIFSSFSQETSPGDLTVKSGDLKKVARRDGRRMFRALALGMAANESRNLDDDEEEKEADKLRQAVVEALCKSEPATEKYEEAIDYITKEFKVLNLKGYCEKIPSPNFPGGEAELLVLSKICEQPIEVYSKETEAEGLRSLFKQTFRCRYLKTYYPSQSESSEGKEKRKPVKLLLSESNHYDLLPNDDLGSEDG